MFYIIINKINIKRRRCILKEFNNNLAKTCCKVSKYMLSFTYNRKEAIWNRKKENYERKRKKE